MHAPVCDGVHTCVSMQMWRSEYTLSIVPQAISVRSNVNFPLGVIYDQLGVKALDSSLGNYHDYVEVGRPPHCGWHHPMDGILEFMNG